MPTMSYPTLHSNLLLAWFKAKLNISKYNFPTDHLFCLSDRLSLPLSFSPLASDSPAKCKKLNCSHLQLLDTQLVLVDSFPRNWESLLFVLEVPGVLT